MKYPRSKRKSKNYVTRQQIALATSMWDKMAATKVIKVRSQDQVAYLVKGQEKSQGKVQEAVLHRAKATLKDSNTMAWEYLRDAALA